MTRSYVVHNVDSQVSVATDLVPTAAAVTLYGRDGEAVLSDQTPTVGVITTVDAASGLGESDASLLNVTTVTGASVGDTCMVEDQYGRREYRTVEGIDSAGVLLLSDPLTRAYESGDAVHVGLGASFVVPADTWDDTELTCRARWTLTVDGAEVVEDTVFDVVASPVVQPITIAQLDAIDPTANDQLPSRLSDWSGVLSESWDHVLSLLESAGLYPHAVIDHSDLQRMHWLSFRLKLAQLGIEPPITYIDGGAVAHFRGELAAEVRSKSLAWVDKDLNLAVGEDEESQIRRVRVC